MTEHRDAAGVPETFKVAVRVGWRLAILCAFALAGSRPFWPTVTTLLALASGLCVVIAAMQRERPLASNLTHWDEAALYALLSRAFLLADPSGASG